MRVGKHLKHCLIPAVILLSFWFCGFSLPVLMKRGGQAFVILGQMLPPDAGYIPKILKPLAATIRMSVGGSFLGAVLALPAAVLACPKLTGHRLPSIFLRGFVSIVRAVPVLVAALAASFILGTGALAGTAAIAFFTFGIVARMTWEKLDHLDYTAFEALAAMGNSRFAAFCHGILPGLAPIFFSDSLYALEINIRHAAILGYVGAGGLGLVLNEKIAWREYSRVGMVLTLLLVIVLLIEQTGEYLRKRLNHTEAIPTSMRRGAGIILALLIIWSLAGLEWKGMPEKGGVILLGICRGLLHPDVSLLWNLTNDGVPWLLFETLCIAIGGTAMGAFFAFPAALAGNRITARRLPAVCIRFIIAAVRTLPSMIAGLIFIRVTGPGAFAGLLTMALLSFGMCSKMFIHTLEQMDGELLAAVRSTGCGWLAAMRHTVWPSCKKALTADVWYRLDVNLRDAAVLGFVGAGGIGAPLIFAMNGYAWEMTGAYLLGLLILVLLADALSAKLAKK